MGCGCKEKAKAKADENAALRNELQRLNRLLAMEREKTTALKAEVVALKA